MAARVLRRAAEAPSKAALRALLAQEAPRLGLTTAAIEEIVRQSQITYWRAGQQIFSQGESHDLANFLVAGAVRVVCEGFHRAPVVVQIVRPAHFFGLGSLFERPGPRLFGAIAHVDAVVAVMSQEALSGVMAALPPGRALQVMAYSWRVLSRLLYEKCLHLTQADLAALVVASRTNVSRCVAALRRAGLVELVGRRLFLTSRFPPVHLDGAVPFGTRNRP